MKFDNTPTSDGGSYEKPAPGKYLGVLVGFCYVGIQPGNGQYSPRAQVMLRWELHKRKGPSKDSKGFVHTQTATFGATVRGENSKLRKALEAHGIDIPEGGQTQSEDWLGKAAWLDLELSDNEKYVNVGNISKLDPDDDTAPAPELPFEHWAGEPNEGLCPSWAAWAVSKSTDLKDRAPAWAGGGGSGQRSTNASGNGAAVGAGVGGGGVEDDGEIPF